jgi:hypothetical protein
MEISFGIPIVREINGDQVDPDYRVVGSINFRFLFQGAALQSVKPLLTF